MIVYKIDVMEALREAGYTPTKIRKEKLASMSTLQYLREGKMVGYQALNDICKMLDMQPGNIIKYVEDEE